MATSRPKNNGIIIGAVVIALAILIGAGWAIQSQRDSTGEDADAPNAADRHSGSQVEEGDQYGLALGDPEAPYKVEVFEDFLCPFCQMFEEATRDDLQQAAKDGEIYLVYRPLPFLNNYSARALNAFGVVMEKSSPQVALAFHNRLFDKQPAETGPMPDDEWLIEQAVAAGAKESEIRKGIENLAFKQWAINGADDGSKRGIVQTPTVFVNGEEVSGSDMEELVSNTLANAGLE